MNPSELLEFSGAIAKSVNCLCVEYRDDHRLLSWVRELITDAIQISGLQNAARLRSEVWGRLLPINQKLLYQLASNCPTLQSGSPIDVSPNSRSRQKSAA